MTLYCVSPFAQKKEVTAYCFKACGRILVGAVVIAGGHFFPCRTTPCPYEKDNVDFGKGDAGEGAESIIVRKLMPYLETP